MELSAFTFVNTTGTPTLSKDSTKQMRGHITRTNFAKRRERKSGAKRGDTPRTTNALVSPRKNMGENSPTEGQVVLLESLSHMASSSHSCISTPSFAKLWRLVFMNGVDPGHKSAMEAAWVEFLSSDSAVLDATLAVGVRHWTPGLSWERCAQLHSSRALHGMVRHLCSGRAHTDAAFVTAVTMAFGEQLAHNEAAMELHIDGVVQLISERRSRGISPVPSLFLNLLTCDAVNYVMGYARFYHRKIIDAMADDHDQPLSKIVGVIDSLVALRDSITDYRETHQESTYLSEEIEVACQGLLTRIRALRLLSNPWTDAAALSLELALHHSWPGASKSLLASIADELRDAIDTTALSHCFFMDITSCQLMLGAAYAEKGSSSNRWFLARFKHVVSALRSRGWANPLKLTNEKLLAEFGLLDSLVQY